MLILILKDAPCILKTRKGTFEVKGHYALNTVSESLLKELRELNPELNEWIDKGVAVINKNAEKVKADGLMEAEKAAAERLAVAEAEAERIIAEAKAKAKAIEDEAITMSASVTKAAAGRNSKEPGSGGARLIGSRSGQDGAAIHKTDGK